MTQPSPSPPRDTPDIAAVDAALRPLWPALDEALATRCPVLVLTNWHPLPEAALLPFHVSLRWPDHFDPLPLNWTGALVPCAGPDRRMLERTLYRIEDVFQARVIARGWRDLAKINQDCDFELEAWETGVRPRRVDLGDRILPGSSYVSVGTVGRNGAVKLAPRAVLGRLATHGPRRMRLLIPGRCTLTRAALDVLAAADLCVCPLAGLRGARAIDTVRAVVGRRLAAPTLLIAHSPSDLFALQMPALDDIAVHIVGVPPVLREVRTRCLGIDRIQEEQTFAEATDGLRGLAPAIDAALDVLESTWWAARQSLAPGTATQTLWPRVQEALDRAQVQAPADAALLTAAAAQVQRTLADTGRAGERLAGLVAAADEHFGRSGGWRTTVLVRDAVDREALCAALEARHGAPYAELRAIGLEVHTAHGLATAADTLIVNGSLGLRTVDLILASGAGDALLVLDPIEARVVNAHAGRLRRFLERVDVAAGHHAGSCPREAVTGAPAACAALAGSPRDSASDGIGVGALARIGVACDRVMARDGGVLHLALDTTTRDLAPPELQTSSQDGPAGPRVRLDFADGSALICPAGQTLDVLQEAGPERFRPVAARDLEPGDEVVVLVSDRQARFSEQMLRRLDEGTLQDLVARRQQWLTIAAALRGKRTIAGIRAGLLARGVTADYQSVRAWLRPPQDGDDGVVPRSWATFRALADELGCALPEELLRAYFTDVRRLRIEHRKKGRALVRIIRAARTEHRLDATTLYRVEREWGMSIRDLIEGARIGVVDDVVAL